MSKRQSISEGLDSLFDIKVPEGILDKRSVLPIASIKPNKEQPRKKIKKKPLTELTESVRKHGVLQAIIVRMIAEDQYEIIAGERRWRAAQAAGLEVIPAECVDVPEESVIAYALVENIQREALTPLEEGQAYKKLINNFKLTHQQVSERVGRSRSAITNMLRLLELEDYAKEYLESGYLEMGHARALLALTDEAQIIAVNKIIDGKLNVRQTEQLVQRLKKPIVKTVTALPAQERILLESWRERLSAYTSQVKIKMDVNKKIKLTIECDSADEAEQLIDDIERLKNPK